MIVRGDCLDVLADMDGGSVDSVVTDPPYGIAFMGKAWDDVGGPKAYQDWCRQWGEAVLRVMKPGAYLSAFGSPRMCHRLTCGLEDAGFDVADGLCWIHGTGFPKSKNDGPRGTALKPAFEPITLCRKPREGSFASNHEKHGCGYLNIDDARVPLDGDAVPEFERRADRSPGLPGQTGLCARRTGDVRGDGCGRWPANVVHDGSDAVLAEFPHTKSGARSRRSMLKGATSMFGFGGVAYVERPSDEGSAARFFYCAKPSRAEREAGAHDLPSTDEPLPGSKLSGNGRRVGDGLSRSNTHPTVKPINLMRWLIRLTVPSGGLVLDPFLGSGTTAIAAFLEGRECVGIEREDEYADIAEARLAWWKRNGRAGLDTNTVLERGPSKQPSNGDMFA